VTKPRLVRIVLTLAITGGCLAYIFWQLDIRRTLDILVHSHLGWFFGAIAVMLGGVPPMAFRWQKLLQARGIRESLGWLNRAYLVSYTAGQVLPSAVGGDASRVALPAVAVAKKRPMKRMKISRKTSMERKKPRSRCGFPSQSIRSPGEISKLTRRSVRRPATAGPSAHRL